MWRDPDKANPSLPWTEDVQQGLAGADGLPGWQCPVLQSLLPPESREPSGKQMEIALAAAPTDLL